MSSFGALAQETPPPPPPEVSPQEEDASFAQRCLAVPAQVWIPSIGGRYRYVPVPGLAPLTTYPSAVPAALPADAPVHAATPVTASPPSTGGGSELADPRVWLIIGVVVVAALPVILYAVDDDAPAVVEQRFHCPTMTFEGFGGAGFASGPSPAGGGRLSFGYGHFGADFDFDLWGDGTRQFGGHLMARLTPKRFIEPSFALGYRSISLAGVVHNSIELSVPHRYVVWRGGLRQVAIELRPVLQINLNNAKDAVEGGLEGGLIVPIVEPIHVRVGGRFQSMGKDFFGSVFGGVGVSL